MLLLKGNKNEEKDIVINCLQDNIRIDLIVYKEYPFSHLKGAYISSKKCSIEAFYNFLDEETKNYCIKPIVIYTDNTEEELSNIIKLIHQKEKENKISDCLIICKE